MGCMGSRICGRDKSKSKSEIKIKIKKQKLSQAPGLVSKHTKNPGINDYASMPALARPVYYNPYNGRTHRRTTSADWESVPGEWAKLCTNSGSAYCKAVDNGTVVRLREPRAGQEDG